jgi:STE24 endopeptidase
MQIVIIAAFVVVLAVPVSEEFGAGAAWSVGALFAYLAITAAIGAVSTIASRRSLKQDKADEDHAAPRPSAARHERLAILQQFWLVAGLAGLVYIGVGDHLAQTADAYRIPLGADAILICPFVVAMLLGWLVEYPAYRAVRSQLVQSGTAPGQVLRLREFLSYNFRHHFLFVALPLGLIFLLRDCLHFFVVPTLVRVWPDQVGAAVEVASVAIAGGVFIISPMLIRLIWRTSPLAAGPLRTELEAMCRALRLKYRDILVWNTSGSVANAAVMGLAGMFRYIFVTDALIAAMDRNSLKAVFAHEAGHIASRHILFMAMFMAAVAMGSSALLAPLPEWLQANTYAQVVFTTLLVAVYVLGFGWISRGFERQSDVIAAWACSADLTDPDWPTKSGGRITPQGANTFAFALSQVAQMSGAPMNQRNWRHGSIASRINFLLWIAATGQTRECIDRPVRRRKWGIAIGFVLAGAALAAEKWIWNIL